MMEYSDEHLVSETLGGSHSAFEQLIKRYQYHVLKTISSLIHDRHTAQDVAQETFLQAWKDLGKLNEKHKFGGWLTRIAINLSKLWLRSQRKYQGNTTSLEAIELDVVSIAPLRIHESEKLRQEIWEAIDELSTAQREVVILHYISGYSYKEIGEMLSISSSTVLGRLQKARNQLRREFLDMVTKLQLEIDSALHEFLKEHAEQNGLSVESLLLRLIERYKKEIDTGIPTAQGAGPTYRLIYNPTGDKPALTYGFDFDFSPSGEQIVLLNRSENRFYLADETGTLLRPLCADCQPWRLAFPTWSPDGRFIAYGARKSLGEKESGGEVSAVFILDPEDGTSRQISPEYVDEWVGIVLWTPDGQSLAYKAKDGIHVVSLDGMEVRFIPDEHSSGLPNLFVSDYSPDGRWLAGVIIRDAETRLCTNICILPVTEDGFATEGHLLNLTIGDIGECRWALDGRALYFPHGVAGAGVNLWKLPMDPDTGTKAGEPQQVTFFKEASIRRPRMVGDSGRIGFSLGTSRKAICVADVSRPDEVLTLAVGRNPQLSPDGQTVYYIDDRPGEQGIYAVPRQGGTPHRLTQNFPLDGFVLSPDGQTLAYITEPGDAHGLFILPTSGGEEPLLLMKLEHPKRPRTSRPLWIPQWSPDGSQLAYEDIGGLYVIPVAGGQPRKLADLERDYGFGGRFRWSPDGKFLAGLGYISSSNPELQNALFVVPASGGEIRQLTPQDPWLGGLDWHPDGQRLTYTVYRHKLHKPEKHQAYLDGRPPSLLYQNPDPDAWDDDGVWEPDGRRFFFLSFSNTTGGIYVYDEATGDITPFYVGNVMDFPVCFSRDGKTITWRTEESVVQLWMMEDSVPEPIAAK